MTKPEAIADAVKYFDLYPTCTIFVLRRHGVYKASQHELKGWAVAEQIGAGNVANYRTEPAPACDHCNDTQTIDGEACGWCVDVAYTMKPAPARLTFKLEIRMGNDAMRTCGDVGKVLQFISAALLLQWAAPLGKDASIIRDDNGNNVGKWEVSADAPGTDVGTWQVTEDDADHADAVPR